MLQEVEREGGSQDEVKSNEEDKKQKKVEGPPSQLYQYTQVQEMEEGSDDEEERNGLSLPPETLMSLSPLPGQVSVQKDCDPKASKPLPPAEYLLSLNTGKKIFAK